MQGTKIINFRWERFKHRIKDIWVNIKHFFHKSFKKDKKMVPDRSQIKDTKRYNKMRGAKKT